MDFSAWIRTINNIIVKGHNVTRNAKEDFFREKIEIFIHDCAFVSDVSSETLPFPPPHPYLLEPLECGLVVRFSFFLVL